MTSFTDAHLSVLIKGDRKTVGALRSAMSPETDQSKGGKRCILSVSGSKEDLLVLSFESKDLISLRASLNTNLRLVSSALKTLGLISSTKVGRKD
ncbi:MAG: KEOPS complex subunit Pcc1 [Nitrososphaerales archaeon]